MRNVTLCAARRQWKGAIDRLLERGLVRVDWGSVRALRRLDGAHEAGVLHLGWAPDGQTLITVSCDRSARVWSAADFSLITTLAAGCRSVYSVRYKPDGVVVATCGGDGRTCLWCTQTWALLRTLTGDTDEAWRQRWGKPAITWDCAWEPEDGALLVTVSQDKTARVFSTSSWAQLCTLRGHLDDVLSCAWAPGKGGTLVTTSADCTAIVWDTSTWSQLHALLGQTDWVRASAFYSPCGKTLLTVSDDGTVMVYRTADWSVRHRFKAHDTYVYGAAWAPDGSFVTCGGDNKAKAWSIVQEGHGSCNVEQVMTLDGHTSWVHAVAFSPTRAGVFATASNDRSVMVWADV